MTTSVDVERLAPYAYPAGAEAFIRDLTPTESGKPFELAAWERDALAMLYGSEPRPRVGLVGVPRAWGKSEFGGRLAWYELLTRGTGIEGIGVANDLDQAKIVLRRMTRLRQRSEILHHLSREYKDAIEIRATGNVYKVLAADVASSWGQAPDFVVFDELHTMPNRDLWDSLYGAIHKRPGAFILALTTAGHDFTSICREVFEIATASREPRWKSVWIAGQEAIAQRPDFVDADAIAEFERTLPPHIFRRLHLNEWVQGAAATWTLAEVEGIFDENLRPTLERKSGRHFLGIDLGLRRDRTAAIVCHKDLEQNLVVVDDARVWQGSREDPVTIGDVEEFIFQMHDRFGGLQIVADPWQMQSTIQRVKAKGCAIEEFNFTTANLRRLSENLYALIHAGQLRCFPDDGLRGELLNIETVSTSYGWRLDHESGGYSDRVMALGMAAMQAVQEQRHVVQIFV